MKHDPSRITADFVRERLNYSPDTGVFTWKRLRNSHRIGEEAKSLDVSGYVQINICGTVCKGHRLAWLCYYGEWPDGHIDHINGVRTDNRIENLRCVSGTVNTQNKRLGSCKNKTGFLGVHMSRGDPQKCFRAKIMVGGKQIHLGGYPTPEEAHKAYVIAKRKYHEGCTI
jgi:hypothetical protein